MAEKMKEMLCMELRTLLRDFERLSETLDHNDKVSKARWHAVQSDINLVLQQLKDLE